MKKKILLSFTVVAIAALAAFNLNFNMNTDSRLSIINLDNIEALAQNETQPGVKTILINQTGTGFACIANKGYNTVTYTRMCIGTGNLECTPGSYTVYVATNQSCGNA